VPEFSKVEPRGVKLPRDVDRLPTHRRDCRRRQGVQHPNRMEERRASRERDKPRSTCIDEVLVLPERSLEAFFHEDEVIAIKSLSSRADAPARLPP
jgi:hypothetical protein